MTEYGAEWDGTSLVTEDCAPFNENIIACVGRALGSGEDDAAYLAALPPELVSSLIVELLALREVARKAVVGLDMMKSWQTDFGQLANNPKYEVSYNKETVDLDTALSALSRISPLDEKKEE